MIWIEEGSTSYQYECKEGADTYDPITDASIAVSYIAKKHKVFDTAGNVIDNPFYGCDTGRGFWWTDILIMLIIHCMLRVGLLLR